MPQPAVAPYAVQRQSDQVPQHRAQVPAGNASPNAGDERDTRRQQKAVQAGDRCLDLVLTEFLAESSRIPQYIPIGDTKDNTTGATATNTTTGHLAERAWPCCHWRSTCVARSDKRHSGARHVNTQQRTERHVGNCRGAANNPTDGRRNRHAC